jgi:Rv0078B-related antitoxin
VDATKLAAERFRIVLDLFETGVQLRRETLRREHPGISPSRLEELLADWLRDRPGAREGDGPPRAS